MHAVLDNKPDLYLDEMRLELEQVCGVSVSLPTIWRNLVKSGYTMKKVRQFTTDKYNHPLTLSKLTCVALERSVEKRADFAARIGTYEPNQLVFVDESAVDRHTTYRGRAWAIRGRKACRKAFFCRGRR
jgi:hypothetical protein